MKKRLLCCAALAAAASVHATQDQEAQAKALVDAHRFKEADQVLSSIQPHTCNSYTLLGRTKANLGDFQQAEALYRACITTVDASFEPAHAALAKLLTHLQRYDEAAVEYDRTLELNPGNAEACLGAGRAAAAQGQEDRAAAYYERSLQLDPSNPLLWFDLGVRAASKGDVDGAVAKFAAAKQLNPSLDMAIVGRIHAGYQQYEAAAAAFEEALQQGTKAGAALLELLIGYGQVAEALRDDARAESLYRRALTSAPDSKEAHLLLANVLTGTGIANLGALHACGLNAAEAREHWRAALPLDAAREALDLCRRRARRWTCAALLRKGPLEAAREALDLCSKELKEAEQWAERAHAVKEGRGPSTSTGAATPTSTSTAKRKLLTLVAGRKGKGGDQGERKWVTELGGYLEVPRVAITSAQHFWDAYVAESRPAVITNFQDGFAPTSSWSWEALAQRFGNELVHVSVSQSGRFDGPEDGGLWGLPGEEILVRPPGSTMRFGDFATLMRANLTETFYIEYLAVHQYLGKAATDMMPLPAAATDSGLELVLTNLWMSKGGTTEVLHYDEYENLLCQLRGTKELTLFPPNDIGRLYYTARKKGHLEYEYPGNFKRDRLADTRAVVFSSGVNLQSPDFKKHPKFKGLRPHRVVLQPGEVLFMPAYWHHEVRSKGDDENPPSNIAVNFWFKNTTYFEAEQRGLASAAGFKSEL
ncbi:cupin-like domain-containing protein [Tribonema minus]|uniref:Cupin-like domain-containing protein n=1 Tax=Tribonema minus TaxID=303371 RepID=A0A835YVM0_9STRA|nr:cupin-like domain-containing protein [Tribonema minus]